MIIAKARIGPRQRTSGVKRTNVRLKPDATGEDVPARTCRRGRAGEDVPARACRRGHAGEDVTGEDAGIERDVA
jgi:hypothetical protein